MPHRARDTWHANFQIQFQTAKRPRSRAAARVGLLVDLPLFEGRRSAERRALVVKNAPFGRSVAATSSSLGPIFRHRREPKFAIRAGFRPPFACTPQPLKAEPHIGLGRLPKAPRVCACEAQPRAPHPTGLGYPAPAKLSLCPTSGSPLEAPLTGQDTSRIRQVVGTGIGIHSHFRERLFPVIPGCALLGADPESSAAHSSGFRACAKWRIPE